MKNSGVVRKIDDLGRIVIPKEIRRTLRIKDGEPIEFFLEQDSIILKKYIQYAENDDYFSRCCASLKTVIDKNIFIVNNNKIVAFSGEYKDDYVGTFASRYVNDIALKKEIVVQEEFDEVNLISEIRDIASFCIVPILVNGEGKGAIVIFSKDCAVRDDEIKVIEFAANFLSNYIE